MNKHFDVFKTVSLEQGLEILNMCSQKRSKDIDVSGELVKIHLPTLTFKKMNCIHFGKIGKFVILEQQKPSVILLNQ